MSLHKRDFIHFAPGVVLLIAASSIQAASDEGGAPPRPPAERRNFVACPIVQDTENVPCWLAQYDGELYFLGIQTDAAGWSPPYLGHKVLVEGKLAGGPKICGGIPLTSQYQASPIPSGKADDGTPLPNPPVTSVMRELDPSCNTLLPTDPRYHILGRRGPGPNVPASALRRPPPSTATPEIERPYRARTFTLTYDFDSELATGTIGNALAAVQYAQAIHAKDLTIVGYRATTLLSDGYVLSEIPNIGELRAEQLAGTVRQLGLPTATKLIVRWNSKPEPADGVTDPERRHSEIIVTP